MSIDVVSSSYLREFDQCKLICCCQQIVSGSWSFEQGLCSYRSWPNSNKVNTHRREIGRRILGHFSPHQCIRYCSFVFICSMPGVPVIKSASPDWKLFGGDPFPVIQCCQLSRIIVVSILECDISRIITKVAISCGLNFPTITFQIFCIVWATVNMECFLISFGMLL